MKAVVIISGGMDSTVLLHHAVKNLGLDVHGISIDYGQRHSRELGCAQQQCQDLKVPHNIIDLRGIATLLKGSSQTDASVPVPHGHYGEENMKKTVVPNRNMLLLAAAGAVAVADKADFLLYGAHNGDHAVYPDCRPEFVHAMANAFDLADWHKVSLFGPFVEMEKVDIVRLGHDLRVSFGHTHTCYEGEVSACGRCGTCVERLLAFELAGIEDPLHYKDREYFREVCKDELTVEGVREVKAPLPLE